MDRTAVVTISAAGSSCSAESSVYCELALWVVKRLKVGSKEGMIGEHKGVFGFE